MACRQARPLLQCCCRHKDSMAFQDHHRRGFLSTSSKTASLWRRSHGPIWSCAQGSCTHPCTRAFLCLTALATIGPTSPQAMLPAGLARRISTSLQPGKGPAYHQHSSSMTSVMRQVQPTACQVMASAPCVHKARPASHGKAWCMLTIVAVYHLPQVHHAQPALRLHAMSVH